MSIGDIHETVEGQGAGNWIRDMLAQRQTHADAVRVARVVVSGWESRLFRATERITRAQREHGRIERRLTEVRQSLAALESAGGFA